MPTEARLLDHLFISIDGDDLASEAMDDLVEVTVETSLHLPDMFTILLHDEELHCIDEGPFELGKEVEISAQPEEGGTSHALIKGEITAIEPEFGQGTQARLLVRGYDRSHRLHRGTHSVAYLQVTDSDLANRIAQEVGLRSQVDSTSEVYDHVLQYNQTHMEFLRERARRIGYEFFVEDETLYFRRPASNDDALELEWGQQLQSFRPRLTLIEQVDEIVVKGWDPETRQAIIGQATQGEAEPDIGEEQNWAQLASEAFDSASRAVVNYDVNSQAEADTLAQAVCDEMSGASIEADGTCFGQPQLRTGKCVNISDLGRRFSGTYFVTAATHVYRAGAAYLTHFSISGRRADTLYAMLEQASRQLPQLWGPMVGIVTNNRDPDDQARVKVKFPWLSNDVESDWTRLTAIGAGAERGFQCLPEVNDEVLVVFEQGDMNRPYIVGSLWNGEDEPPLASDETLSNGRVHMRTFKTRVGHALTFIDDGEDEGVVLETARGHKLTLSDDEQKVTVETAGGHVLTLDDSRSEVSVESSGNMTLKSNANLSIEANGNLELKGQSFSLSANASGEVSSSGVLTVRGSVVRIN